MAAARRVGSNEPCFTRPSERTTGKVSTSECSGSRSPISQNHRKKGEVYGFDGGKWVKGRKRHLLVDSLGLLLKVIVTEANASERIVAAYALLSLVEENQKLLSQVQVLWVDAGYRGDSFALAVWLMIQARIEVIQRQGAGFEILPKRWVVERTFGWLNWYRRLSQDYERLLEMSEAAIYAVMTRIMLRRLVS
jgi:putative transposase